MKDNIGLMLVLFGLSMIYWIIIAFTISDLIVFGILFANLIIAIWMLRPRGESKKLDKFRIQVVLITNVPFYLVTYKKIIGD